MGNRGQGRWVRELAKRVGRGLNLGGGAEPAETKRGLPPGTIVYTGEERDEPVRVRIFEFDDKRHTERQVSPEAVSRLRRSPDKVLWVDVEGVHDVELLQEIGKCFGLHDLVLEDIASVGQRPKFEGYDDYAYIVLRMLHQQPDVGVVDEQLSIVLGRGFVLTFQEHQGDVFDALRERIRTDRGRIRQHGADYLAYRLIDVTVDGYFDILADMDDQIDRLEETVQKTATGSSIQKVYAIRRELVTQRRVVWPLREVAAALARDEVDLIEDSLNPYLRDLQDHVARVLDLIESLRENADGLVELGHSIQGQRLNEVMKLLTIISTVFIPLSFIAGLYGMNFDYMPELHWRWGYFAALGAMLSVSLGLLYYFRRRHWL
ncbi:MAG: magnesium/cobalt transporter CorA [Polyangiaceae bacterium]